MVHTAEIMTYNVPTPSGARRIAYINRHPADNAELGYVVLRFYEGWAVGAEVAWDGHKIRSLPENWREMVEVTAIEE